LHIHKANDKVIQNIKAQRPYLRGNYINSEHVKKLRKLENDIQIRDTTIGFNKPKIVENEHLVTEEVKKKREKKVLFDKDALTKYLENRTKNRANGFELDNLQCKEREFIQKYSESSIKT
jgi:hypothetical protein